MYRINASIFVKKYNYFLDATLPVNKFILFDSHGELENTIFGPRLHTIFFLLVNESFKILQSHFKTYLSIYLRIIYED